MQEAVEGVESGMVLQELQKGYKLKDRVIRPSMVKRRIIYIKEDESLWVKLSVST